MLAVPSLQWLMETNHRKECTQRRLECHFVQLAKTKYNYIPRYSDTVNNFGVILQLYIYKIPKFNVKVTSGEVESFEPIIVP